MPVVRPDSLQITARGRVVFQLFPSSAATTNDQKLWDSVNNNNNNNQHTEAAPKGRPSDVAEMMSFLSPEFRDSINDVQTQQNPFSESDIEKVRMPRSGSGVEGRYQGCILSRESLSGGQIASQTHTLGGSCEAYPDD